MTNSFSSLSVLTIIALASALSLTARAQEGEWSMEFAEQNFWVPTALVPLDGRLYVGIATGGLGGGIQHAPQNYTVPTAGIWDGEEWEPIGPGNVLPALDFLVDGEDIYVANADIFGGEIFGVALWDGEQWRRLGDGFSDGVIFGGGGVYDSFVSSLEKVGDDIYAAGFFIYNDEPYSFARWDGSEWFPMELSDGPAGAINAMEVFDGDISIGGEFPQIGEVSGTARLARWDGASWHAVGDLEGNDVFDLTPFGSGFAIAHEGGVSYWDGNSLTELGDAPGTTAVVEHDGELYSGVTSESSFDRGAVLRWDGSEWTELEGYWSVVDSNEQLSVLTLASYGGELHTGRARWDGSNWTRVGNGLTLRGNRYGFDAEVYQGDLHVVTATGDVERWDGTRWTFLDDIDGVLDIEAQGTSLYFGGLLSNVGGLSNADGVVEWDGSEWQNLGTGIQSGVWTLFFWGDDLYVGGGFDDAGGNQDADVVARWDGSAWQALPGLEGIVYDFAVADGQLCIGGRFTIDGSSSTRQVACWDGSVWQPAGNSPGGDVDALAFWNGNLYAGGGFSGGVKRLNEGVWETVGSGLFSVNTLEASARGLIAGGEFESAGGNPEANSLAVWDGESWSDLAGPVNFKSGENLNSGEDEVQAGEVWGLTLANDSLLVAGEFNLVNGVQSSGIAVYTDPALTVNAEANSPVSSARLSFPYPNPFASETSFDLEIPSAGFVRIEAYDVLGRRVAVIHDGTITAGQHTLIWRAVDLPGGIYIVRVTGSGINEARSVVRIR